MMTRSQSFLVAALGLCLTHPVPGQEPAPMRMAHGSSPQVVRPSENQRMADLIAAHLRQCPQLTQFTLNVTYQDGRADLEGAVADEAQREEILRVVRAVPGVTKIMNRLTVSPVMPAQAIGAAPAPAPVPQGTLPPAVGNGMMMEPTPIHASAPPSFYDLNPPRMPPHAWPTYAPYNNYSRVAYPTHYPYQAWPFIGPFYPFPKVPLGWRSVKLEWEDGHWWYQQCATQRDWWRIRYW